MFKIAMYIIIFACCTGAGLIFAHSFKTRMDILKAFILSIEQLKTEISYLLMPLPSAFEAIAKQETSVKDFYFACSNRLKFKEGKNLSEIWDEELSFFKNQTSMGDEELMILSSLGEQLGKSHEEGQLRTLDYARSQLLGLDEKLSKHYASMIPLARNFGAITGAFLIILMI